MASQQESAQPEAQNRSNGVGEGERGGDGKGADSNQISSPSPPERSSDAANDKRIGPWDPPDYNRQRALADRLSNPSLRASRPSSSVGASDQQQQQQHQHQQPSLADSSKIHSPYRLRRPRTTASAPVGSRMSSANSGPRGSPRRESSPRRQLSTPRYGSMSPRRQPPLFPTVTNTRKVSEDELNDIVSRVTRPTVSSRGGVDLQDKDFTYIKPKRLKTLPVVPGLERRYLGLQSVDTGRMDDIVIRLTRMTTAYSAKFATNKNVWIDMEPGAHMVQRRSAQSAV